jgi:hypothetical protein
MIDRLAAQRPRAESAVNASAVVWLLVIATTVTTGCAGSGPPSERDQAAEAKLLSLLKDKGSFIQPDGSYELTVEKVDGLDLLNLEVKWSKDGKVEKILKSPKRARVKIDRDATSMRIQVEECTVESEGIITEMKRQEFDLPLPQFEKN